MYLKNITYEEYSIQEPATGKEPEAVKKDPPGHAAGGGQHSEKHQKFGAQPSKQEGAHQAPEGHT